jgi:hypothetical protein
MGFSVAFLAWLRMWYLDPSRNILETYQNGTETDLKRIEIDLQPYRDVLV